MQQKKYLKNKHQHLLTNFNFAIRCSKIKQQFLLLFLHLFVKIIHNASKCENVIQLKVSPFCLCECVGVYLRLTITIAPTIII